MDTAILFYWLFRALQAYYYILIAYVLLSWIPEIRKSKLYEILSKITDPYMRIFRGLFVVGMMDFTPILGFILYQVGLNYFAQAVNLMLAG